MPDVVANVKDFGAETDGRDCVEAFNDAVQSVGEADGGAVLVPAGTYVLSGPIWMHWSNVVLRGAGSGTTVLHFTRPLAQSYWPRGWSADGGQIFVIPAEHRTFMEEETGWGGPYTWLLGDRLATVGSASRGQRTLVVSNTSGLNAGDMVVLEAEHGGEPELYKHLAGDIPAAHAYDWDGRAENLLEGPSGSLDSLRWPVRIDSVLGEGLVRIAQPLKYDLRPDWPAQLREIGPAVHDTGVEGLTIYNEVLPQQPHHQDPGSNGLCFSYSYDCWARDVRVENVDCGFVSTCCKSMTWTDVTVAGRGNHHSFMLKLQSCDNLVEDFTIEEFTVPVPSGAVTHGVHMNNLSNGNVYRRGDMQEGTFDSHRGLPFENVRTDITLKNTGLSSGASATNGPNYGARSAHWNVRVTSDRLHAITIADLAPRSVSVGIQGLDDPTSDQPPDYPIFMPEIEWPPVFDDGFDEAPTGQLPAAYERQGPEGTATVQPDESAGNVLVITRTDQDVPVGVIRDFEATEGNVLLSFNVKTNAGDDRAAFVAELFDSSDNVVSKIDFARAGIVRYSVGNGASTESSSFSFTRNQWHRVDIVIDGGERLYDLYVDSVLVAGQEALSGSGWPSTLVLRLSNNNPRYDGTSSVDDVAVYAGDPADGIPVAESDLESVIMDFDAEPAIVDLYAEQRVLADG